MRIGLIDVDGHNFPNLALMKISAYHKAKGDDVEWANAFFHYDRIYKSKVFTFTKENSVCYDADEVLCGGTGYDVSAKLPPLLSPALLQTIPSILSISSPFSSSHGAA